MVKLPKAFRTAVLTCLGGVALAVATVVPASAHYSYRQCDGDGDRCWRVVCDDDGDRCYRVLDDRGGYYNRGGDNNGGGYYGGDGNYRRGDYNRGGDYRREGDRGEYRNGRVRFRIIIGGGR
jgi:hypothetical protein